MLQRRFRCYCQCHCRFLRSGVIIRRLTALPGQSGLDSVHGIRRARNAQDSTHSDSTHSDSTHSDSTHSIIQGFVRIGSIPAPVSLAHSFGRLSLRAERREATADMDDANVASMRAVLLCLEGTSFRRALMFSVLDDDESSSVSLLYRVGMVNHVLVRSACRGLRRVFPSTLTSVSVVLRFACDLLQYPALAAISALPQSKPMQVERCA
ncbi:hypothetical protein R3P38DRAFT_1741619 [Favolaschia claudopus]|uniref:Uncharacterized protein n=1 Tax=Favolaschia claudopus TaxID=2862362 RepID=A0AAW0DJ31_9AGAR